MCFPKSLGSGVGNSKVEWFCSVKSSAGKSLFQCSLLVLMLVFTCVVLGMSSWGFGELC